MAERKVSNGGLPGTRTFGTAAITAGQRFSWLWSRESLLRLILSFVLATALWLYVTGKQSPNFAFSYDQALPIATEGLGPNLVVTNNLDSVHLRIRVANPNVGVSRASFHPFVSLSGLGPGRHSKVPVRVETDPGIVVQQVRPARIAVVVEPIRQKQVSVKVRVLKHPPAGYAVGNIVLKPSVVTVSGPSSIVSRVTQAVVNLNLSQTRYNTRGYYKLYPEDSTGAAVSATTHLTVKPAEVELTAPVQALTDYKTLPILARLTGQPKAGVGVVRVSVSPSEITAFGAPSRLGQTTSVTTTAVSVAHRGAGAFTTHAKISLPRHLSTHTRGVKVTVRLAPVTASSSIPIAVVPINVPAGLTANTSPASILVIVEGPASALQGAARHIRATVDLSTVGLGTYQLAPVITHGPRLKIVGVYPSTVSVVLSSPQSG